MKKIISILLVAISIGFSAYGQEKVQRTFHATRIINSHTNELLKSGILEFRISHRFGSIDGGLSQFFGLDQASIRYALEYGINDWLMVGLGRSTFENTVDGFFKTRLVHQKKDGTPVSVNYFANIAINTLPMSSSERDADFTQRLAYAHQIIVARKFSEEFSLQISPTLVHQNLVTLVDDDNLTFAVGVGGKYNLTKVVSINAEYIYRIPQSDSPAFDNNHNSLSVGVNLETRKHLFSLTLSNSVGQVEHIFITETADDWLDGNIRFGFNILREFNLNKKRGK